MEKQELDELDDLLAEEDLMEYQVILEGYDENDKSVNYYEIIKISKDEDEAVNFAQKYDETFGLLSKAILEKRKRYAEIFCISCINLHIQQVKRN